MRNRRHPLLAVVYWITIIVLSVVIYAATDDADTIPQWDSPLPAQSEYLP